MSQILLKSLLRTLVILRDSICVDVYEVFFVCLIATSLPTLAYMLESPLFDLRFDKEACVTI